MEWARIACLAVLLTACGKLRAADGSDKPIGPAPDAKWRLIWSDEFAHDGLPDPAKWVCEKGFVRNQEPQYYTARRENARVEDGVLILEARRERFQNAAYQADGKDYKTRREFADYTSASIATRGLFAFQYGRVEFRAQLPAGAALWPAVWTLGADVKSVGWPACGEIDIMEWWGSRPGAMTSTLHFKKDGRHQQDHAATTQPASITGFHLYALEWYPDHMDFYFDGKPYHHVDLSKLDDQSASPFRKPHFLLIDLALDPHQKEGDALPQQLKVDYIRVYQLRSADGAGGGPGHAER